MPRSPSTSIRRPVVSGALIRSPVDARCAGVAAIKFLDSLRRTSQSGRKSQTPAKKLANDVIVHDVRKQQQKEDKSNLDEPFFHCQAQVAAQESLDREHHDHAAV